MKAISFLLLLISACSSYDEGLSVEQTFAKRKFHFEQCYYESDLYMNRRPGTIDIHFIINSDGKVMNPKIVDSDFKDANLNACLMMVLKQLNFHHEQANQEFTKTFNFNPARK